MGKFADDVDKFVLDVQGLSVEVIKKIAFEIYIRVVKRTRYRTGRARGSWLISVGHNNSDVPNRLTSGPDSSEYQKLSEFSAPRGSIFITSNLSYIGYLEYGTDKFPGDHMMLRTVEEFQPIVQQMVQETRRGRS